MDDKQIPWVPASKAVNLQACQTPSRLELRPSTGSLHPPQIPTFQSVSPGLLVRLLDFLRFLFVFTFPFLFGCLGFTTSRAFSKAPYSSIRYCLNRSPKNNQCEERKDLEACKPGSEPCSALPSWVRSRQVTNLSEQQFSIGKMGILCFCF